MTGLRSLAAALGTTLVCTGSADAGTNFNGLLPNGLSLNGLSANGVVLNGLHLNGVALNGVSMNGVSMNGANLNGLHANGAGLQIDKAGADDASAPARSLHDLARSGLEVAGTPAHR